MREEMMATEMVESFMADMLCFEEDGRGKAIRSFQCVVEEYI